MLGCSGLGFIWLSWSRLMMGAGVIVSSLRWGVWVSLAFREKVRLPRGYMILGVAIAGKCICSSVSWWVRFSLLVECIG